MRPTRLVLFAIVSLGLVFGVSAYMRGRNGETRYQTAQPDRGDVVEVVGATGTLQAVTTVQVGSQVSGTIQSLMADFNSVVKKGQVIARLDPSTFEARLGQARANLVSARANVERSRAQVTDARQKFERARELAAQNLVPESDLETAKANHDGAVAQIKASEAAVSQAEASVNQAEVDLAHTVIEAPIDGVVINRSVDVGQTVAASFQAPVLFVIANDLTRMQVNASIDEADIGRVKVDQEVSFRVDAHPERTFVGRVEQVRLQPTTVQNVVTYNTIISVDNAEQLLMPGMTATVSLIVRKAEDVVRVPASALRFRPEGFDAQAWMRAQFAARADDQRAEGQQASGGGQAAAAEARGPGAGGAGAAEGAGQGRASLGSGAGGPGGGGAGRGPGGGMGMRGGQGRGARSGSGPSIVFVVGKDGRPEPRLVRLGITDGQFVEVRDGLAEGVSVVTGIDTSKASATARPSGSPSTNPFGPQRPQPRQR
ncbi:MAG: efflux RND transporter periplasmic adaptor subunit [Vicinamibacteria bacterium]